MSHCPRIFTSVACSWAIATLTIITSLSVGACAGSNSGNSQEANSQSKIVLIPNAVDFKEVALGEKNTQTIKITNHDTNAVRVNRISVAGSAFAVKDVTFPFSLAPRASGTFNIEFAPKSAGAVSGKLTIESNLPDAEVLPVKGVGAKALPKLQTSPASINFGNLAVKGNAAQRVVVANKGNSKLTVTQVAISGSGFAVSDLPSHFDLAPQQEFTFLVTFHPQVKGTVKGSLQFISKELTPLTVSLAGAAGDGGHTPSGSGHTVTLNWDASPGNVQGYYVYRSEVSGGPYDRISTLVNSLTYSDSTVQSGRDYFYAVTSVNHGGHESMHSQEVSVTIPSP